MNPIKQNIINALNIQALSSEEQEKIMVRVGTLIYQNVLMRVLSIMSEEEENEFEKLLDANAQPEEIFTFLQSKEPNLDQIIEEEAIQFKNKSDSIMSQIGN